MSRFLIDDDDEDFETIDSSSVVPFLAADALVWWVQPANSRGAWQMDLSEFASGYQQEGVAARPQLIRQLAPAIRALSLGKPKGMASETKLVLRRFWRLLDVLERAGLSPINQVSQFQNKHGALFKVTLLQTWKLKVGYARRFLSLIRRWVNLSRQIASTAQPSLIWPTIKPERGTLHKDIDPALLRPIYHHLKRRHVGFLSANVEGERLRVAGEDPRVAAGRKTEVWGKDENWALLAFGYVEASLREGALPLSVFAERLTPLRDGNLDRQPGPSFLPEQTRTSFDTVRWFVPTIEDALSAFVLVMLHTGWNPETVKAIDISSDAEWFDHRLDGGEDPESKSATVAIYSMKGRTGREQIAFSLRHPSGHPFQVIKSMIARTAPLRERLIAEIKSIEARSAMTMKEDSRLAELRVMAKSPWLFFSPRFNEIGGRVGVISKSDDNIVFRRLAKQAFAKLPRSLADVRAEAIEEFLRGLTLSDIRDGFASYIYDNSLFNVLLLKSALGHGSVRTTRAYLRQRRQIAHRFGRFTEFQEAVFDEIKTQARLDPTILHVRLSGYQITDELRGRLSDTRERSRMGMGCVDPLNPPANIAPDHKGGMCRVQRCTLCIHGVVFEDSLPDLAIRAAELQYIRNRVSIERFEGSTFQMEWIAIEITVEHLYASRRAEFDNAIIEHLALLRNGAAYLFDQIPPAFITDAVL